MVIQDREQAREQAIDNWLAGFRKTLAWRRDDAGRELRIFRTPDAYGWAIIGTHGEERSEVGFETEGQAATNLAAEVGLLDF